MLSTPRQLTPFFIAALFSFSHIFGAEDYTGWNYSQTILLNTTVGGAGVSGTIRKFPVLIRLNPGNFRFFSQTAAGGADIRFATTNDTHLPYQISRWVDGAGNNDTAEIWVAVDTVFGNAISQKLLMFWGKDGAADSSKSTAVFDTSSATTGGYLGAYHLDGNLDDATGYERDGSNHGSTTTASGLIGPARSFNGSQYFSIGQLPNRTTGTISGWFRLNSKFDNSSGTTQGLWCVKRNDSYNASLGLRGGDYELGNGSTGAFQTKIEYDSSSAYLAGRTTSFDAGRWYYVAWTWGYGSEAFYLDGNSENTLDSSKTVGSDGLGNDLIGVSYFDEGNISDVIRYFKGAVDEFQIHKIKRDQDWVKLSYQNQKQAQSLVTTTGVFKWDISTATGIQPGNGIWGTNLYWTQNETQLTAWPGRGYAAQFSGTAGPRSITVTGTQLVDSIAFLSSTYTLSGGTLNFGSFKGAMYLASGVTATVQSMIAGSGGLTISRGSGISHPTLNLNGANSYTGVTTITGDISCNIATFADGGENSGLGASPADAANLILDKGVLRHTGSAAGGDRLFTVTANGASIYASGTGSLNFTSTGAIAFSGTGNRTLEFGGLNTAGENLFAPVIGNGTGGVTSVIKSGSANTWVFSGAHTYTGATGVNSGVLIVNGSLHSGSTVTVADGAVLGGNGNIAGAVDANGTVEPGHNGAGKLRTGPLNLHGTSVLNFDLGTAGDSLLISGDLTLDGTLNITAGTGFSEGEYRLLSWTGTLTDNTLEIGTVPDGYNGELQFTGSTLSIVFSKGLIQKEPADTTVIVGQQADFSVTATGTVTYKWERLRESSVDSVGNAATYSIAATATADTNARFRCIVKNESSVTDTSRWATLTVIIKPRIASLSSDTSVFVGDAVTCAVTIIDTSGCSYDWRKVGDFNTLSTDSVYEIAAATINDTGGYFCLITNPAGTVQTDVIHIGVSYPKPAAKFSFTPASGGLPLEVSFFDSSNGIISSRWWDFGDGSTDSATNPKHIYTKTGIFTVKLIVSGPGGADTMTQPDGISVTGIKTNPLTIAGVNIDERKVQITISNIHLIDTAPPEPWCDSIGIWISPGELPKNSGDAQLVKRYPRSRFSGTTLVDTLTFPATDSVFGVIAGLFWEDGTIGDFLVMNGMMVDFRDKTNRTNPLRITGRKLDEMDVAVTITNIDMVDTVMPAPQCDSIGIWVMPDSLPKNYNAALRFRTYPRWQFMGSSLSDTLHLPSTDSIYGIMTGLFWNDGSISDFHAENGLLIDLRDSSSTGRDTSLANSVRITDLRYDSLGALLRVSWCIDTGNYNGDLDIGISYGFSGYPDEMSGSQTVVVLNECTDTTVNLSEPLLFDTLYYVRLFVRKPTGVWNAGGDSTKGTVQTGHPFRQIVTYFNPDVDNDTTSAFNGAVVLWKDSSLNNNTLTVDTLEIVKKDAPAGFIAAGTAVRFLKALKGPAFYLGFKATVPAGESIGDVRIFRDSAGVLLVDYTSTLDPAGGIVYVRASDVRLPFIPLIDRNKPDVSFLTDINSVVLPDSDLVDSVKVVDNIANVKWNYLYSSADEVPVVRDSGYMDDTSCIRRLFISRTAHVISSEFGVRALFLVNDGTYTETFDLSRSVYRRNSDPSTTTGGKWQPVYPTAVLDGSDPDSLIVACVNEKLEYDNRYMLLYRWVEVSGNRDRDSKWIEYEPDDLSIRELFRVVPGRLLWIKTRDNVPLSLGPARTLSLKDTFALELPPEQYTDFGMPYRFGVKISDMLAASSADAANIMYLRWVEDEETGRLKCEPVYSSTLPEYKNPSAIMKFENGGGYSFYNPLEDTVTIRIPPVLGIADADTSASLGKKTGDKSWSAKLTAVSNDGFRFPDIYCGYNEGVAKSHYPVSPSFEKVQVCLFNRDNGIRQGHYIRNDAAEGIVKELQVTNTSDSVVRIAFSFSTTGAFPESYASHLYDNETGTFLGDGTITAAPHSTVYRWVTVGDQQLRDRFLAAAGSFCYALHRIYPNPARSFVNINYSVPLGSQELLHIGIYDLRGRKIWEKRITHLLAPGNHCTTWNGRTGGSARAGAGIYVIRMSVVNPQGKTIKRFDECITFLP